MAQIALATSPTRDRRDIFITWAARSNIAQQQPSSLPNQTGFSEDTDEEDAGPNPELSFGSGRNIFADDPPERTDILNEDFSGQETMVAASEFTPLIFKPPAPAKTRSETAILLEYSLPIFITQLIESSFYVVTLISVGHAGSVNELAAASLGSMTANLVGISLIFGIVGALDTLCPQAWTSNPKQMSLHCQRVALMLAIVLVPSIALFWNADRVLLFVGQDPEVAVLTGLYLKIVSLGLPGMAGFEIIRRWLQSQGIMHAPTLVVFTAAPLNVLLNYILVWLPPPVGLGFAGAAWSMVIVPYVMLIEGFAYCYFFAPRDAWGGFDKAALDVRQWSETIKLSGASLAMVVAEWWAWEVLTFSVSYLGPTILAVQACLNSIQFVAYQVALAVSSASAVRVGNLIGAGEPEQAAKAAVKGLSLGFKCGVFNTVLLFLLRNHVGKVFTTDPDVLRLIAQILPIVACYQIFDSTSAVAFGVLRGSGRSHVAAVLTAVSYWIVGIPTSLCLVFLTPLKLSGLWIATTISLFFCALFCTIYISRIDFQAETDMAKARAASAGQKQPAITTA